MRKLRLEELNRLSNDEFKIAPKIPVAIILDDIRSAMNVGSVFRSADAFAIEKIYLVGITAKPPHREIQKTAIGATESVEWDYSDNRVALHQKLKEDGFHILAIEQTDASIPLTDLKINQDDKFAIVLGNEVDGVHQFWIDSADKAIELKQYGTKHSLNISVCAGIVLFYLSMNFRI